MQFIQTVIDRMLQRMLPSDETKSLSEKLALLHRENWFSGASPPWFDGGIFVIELAERFGFNAPDTIPNFRECMRSLKTQTELLVLMAIEEIIPISTAAAECEFSQLNLVATNNLTASSISDILFIRLNEPPAALWDPSSTRSRKLREIIERLMAHEADYKETSYY